jgi:CBS domain-containing protein
MAIAGPGASFVLAAVFYLLALAVGSGGGRSLTEVFLWLAVVNGMLGAFNLLPGFPLDGGRVLRAGLWHWLHNLPEATRIAAGFGQGLGTLLIVLGLLEFMLGGGARWNGVWLAFIGWFVIQAAQSSYQQILARHVLAGISVADIMTRQVDVVPAACTLDEVIHDHVMVHSHPAYPVFDGDRLLGLISLNDLRNVPRERRSTMRASEVVSPLTEAQTVAPTTGVWEALGKMMSGSQGRLLVLEEGRLVGIVSRTDVMHVMRRRMELGV